MATAALYARYSSDLQREASIADQFRLLREHAGRIGLAVAAEFADAAISGASTIGRPGLAALLAGARDGRFRVVLAEALDRLSRDQEDVAGIWKRLRHAGVRLVTLAEGEVDELHIGLKGTMNALFLRDLAAKVRRGQRQPGGAMRSGHAVGKAEALPEAAYDGRLGQDEPADDEAGREHDGPADEDAEDGHGVSFQRRPGPRPPGVQSRM